MFTRGALYLLNSSGWSRLLHLWWNWRIYFVHCEGWEAQQQKPLVTSQFHEGFLKLHSLKLTACTWNRPSQQERIVFQPFFFRCKLALSFREGTCPPTILSVCVNISKLAFWCVHDVIHVELLGSPVETWFTVGRGYLHYIYLGKL